MSRVRFNHWPTHASMAETLTNADLLRIDRRDVIEDMTHDEMLGVEQVLIDRIAGIDASMASLMELRVKTSQVVREIEEVRFGKFVEPYGGDGD